MATRISRRALALLSLVIFGSACESGTGPDGGDGFRATLDDYEALDAALSSGAWSGFRALADRTPYGASARMSAVATLDDLADGAPAFAQSLAASLAPGGPAAAPIISATHRGKTFVYDATRDQYVIGERDFSIVGDVRGAQEGVESEGDVDLTVRHGDHSIRVDAAALVIHRILDSVEDVFDLLEDLLDPIDDLVFWGMVL